MLEAFDLSSYGKGDVIPATLVLAVGLLWATFIPDRKSPKYGLRPMTSIVRAVLGGLGLVIALESSEAGYLAFGAVLGGLVVGFAIAPAFVLSPPTNSALENDGVPPFIKDFGNRFLDKVFGKLIIAVVGGAASWLFGFNTAIWCTVAFISLLLILKTGKAQEAAPDRFARPNGWLVMLALIATSCMATASIAYAAIASNIPQLQLSDVIRYLVVVGGVTLGALF